MLFLPATGIFFFLLKVKEELSGGGRKERRKGGKEGKKELLREFERGGRDGQLIGRKQRSCNQPVLWRGGDEGGERKGRGTSRRDSCRSGRNNYLVKSIFFVL